MIRFESVVMAFCDRFLSQRSFDLIVAPALADLEFEDAGRRGWIATRAAVVRAMAGGLGRDMQSATPGFFKLALLSLSYFGFPLLLSGSYFKTWAEWFVAATFVLVMSLVPVMVCFWPSRQPVRPNE